MLKIHNQFKNQNKITLYQGDCIDFLKSVPNNSISLIVTSPPYNLGKEYEKRICIDDYVVWQRDVIKECCRVVKPGGHICWQVGNCVNEGEVFPIDLLLYPIFKELRLSMRNRIIWHFGHGLHATKRFSGRYETIMWFTKGDKYYFNLDPIRVPSKYPNKKYFKGAKKGQLSCNPLGKNPSDVWDMPNVKHNHIEKTEHPCQFPVALVERLVLSMTQEGDIVLDPFLGSGSTFIASLLHNRKVAGSEIEDKYIQIVKNRILEFASNKIRVRDSSAPLLFGFVS